MGAPRKRVRVRVARWSGTCPVCRAPILGGQQIASVRGGPWVHVGHVIPARPGPVAGAAGRPA